MIVGVCSDKGSPGATTLAAALGLVWPGPHCVAECDPSGGVLTFRMLHSVSGGMLEPEPTLASMAAGARVGGGAEVMRFAQPTSLGVPVIPGPLTAQRWVPIRALWPQVATTMQRWPGTVLADLGRLQPGNAALPVAQAATAVLLVGRADVEGLHGLRERAASLAHVLGHPDRDKPSVAVVVTAPAGDRREALSSVTQMLSAAGSPVPVAGFFPQDPAGATRFWTGVMTKKLAKSELLRSVTALAETVLGWWPELVTDGQPPVDLTEETPMAPSFFGAAAVSEEGVSR